MFIVHALPTGEPSPSTTDRAVVADDRSPCRRLRDAGPGCFAFRIDRA